MLKDLSVNSAELPQTVKTVDLVSCFRKVPLLAPELQDLQTSSLNLLAKFAKEVALVRTILALRVEIANQISLAAASAASPLVVQRYLQRVW